MKNIEKYKSIFQMLLDGINPRTGEYLPKDNLYTCPDMIRALHYALVALNEYKEKTKPEKAGEPWTQSDDERLENLFKQGHTITEIAKEMGRTNGAIESRLVRNGLVKNKYEASARNEGDI